MPTRVVKVTYALSGKPKPPSAIKARALRYVDKENYNVLIRNCEHFATWCVYGKAVSGNVRAVITTTTIAAGTVVGATFGTIVAPGPGTAVGASIGTAVGLAGGALGLGITMIVYEVTAESEEFE